MQNAFKYADTDRGVDVFVEKSKNVYKIYITDYTKNSSYYYAIGKICLSNYYSRYGSAFNQKVENTEIELNFIIEGYKLRGVIDRLDQPESGKWVVHDYKTGKNVKSKRQALIENI